VQKSRISGILRAPDFIGVLTRHNLVAKVQRLRQAFPMIFSPSRAEILDAVQHADFNPLACRVARALADYELAFSAEAQRCGSFDYIRLSPPTDEIEAVALDLFLDEAQARLPRTEIKIKRIGGRDREQAISNL
jgi:hypothetical protein